MAGVEKENMTVQVKALGRRPGGTDTRSVILETARQLFSEKGYEHTTIRLVAASAQVDPALPMHYFKNKQRLFLEAMLPDYKGPDLLAQALSSIQKPEEFAPKITMLLVRMMEDRDTRSTLTGLIRAAASEPDAAQLMRVFVEERIILPISYALGGAQAALQADLLGSHIVGIFLTRYIIGLEPLASANSQEIAATLEPIVSQYVLVRAD